MKIVKKQITELLPASYNPRKDLQLNDKEMQQLINSIKEFGYVEPIIYNIKTNVVVGGHQRLKALKHLGYEEVDVVEIDIEEDKEKALNIALNKISGDWDNSKLAELLKELDTEGFNLDLTGFSREEIDELYSELDTDGLETKESEPEVEEDEFDVEENLPEEPISKYGDIWQLGNHRLMCGDSTKSEDVSKLMTGVKADLVHTDPPYGMKKEKDGVLNDNLNYDDLLEFNKKWIPLTFENLKSNGSWYCWGIDEPLMDIYVEILKPMIQQNKVTFRNLITWDKGNGQGQLSELFRSYARADEKCLFVMCGVQGFSTNTDNYYEGFEPIRSYLEQEAKKVGLDAKKLKEITGVGMYSHWFTKAQWVLIPEEHYKKIQNYYNGVAFKQEYEVLKQEYEAFKLEYESLKQEWYKTRAYFNNSHDNMNNVWHFDRAGKEERELTGGHATPKPLKLCARAIKSSSRENEIVLDVFGGSGSTLIAAEQLNRTCYMMELDPRYVDVIIKRWETLTGKKATRLEEGKCNDTIG